jgi:RNA polymerase sigma-70 factor (ECF subfamily)
LKGSWDLGRDPLRALAQGDPALFEEFVHTEAPTLIGFFVRLGAERGEAEDLTQDVCLKLYRNAATYQAQQAFPAYVLRVARNAWIDRRRRGAAAPRPRSLSAPGPQGGRELGSSLPTDAPEPGHALGVREEARLLLAALAQLSLGQRMVFELAILQERPYAEIAAELDIPVGTVKSRVFHAVRKLRAVLEPADDAAAAVKPAKRGQP